MAAKPTRRIQVVLRADQYERLEAHAREQGRSVSAVVREALERVLLPDLERLRREAALRWLFSQELPVADWAEMERETERMWEVCETAAVVDGAEWPWQGGAIMSWPPEEVRPMAYGQLRHEDRIVQDPRIMVGKPVVKGTRIPVERVIRHLAENPDLRDLLQAFPHLTVEDVKACLAYAHAQLERQQARAVRTAPRVQRTTEG